jgi:ArsR family transcriptional regulator
MVDSTNFETTNLETTDFETTPLERTPPSLADLLTVFKALSDPTRLAIVEHLATGQHCVCELQTVLELPANLLSHHLRVLREAGVVRDQRRGRWIDYALEPSVLHSLQRALEHCYTLTSSPQTATTNTACASPEEVAS